MDILYFPCCYTTFDPRLKKVAQATARILNKAGVDYGILGAKESCCGESIRKTGNEDLFKKLAKENIKNFIDSGVTKILVSSPHCYHTFKNEYPQFKVNFEVTHISQYLSELSLQASSRSRRSMRRRSPTMTPATWAAITAYSTSPGGLNEDPGIELVELPETKLDSTCCGMGGGRIWMETEKEERFSNLRVEQAIGVGAKELVTSCPYCITALEDSRLVLNQADNIEIKDITEILQEVI